MFGFKDLYCRHIKIRACLGKSYQLNPSPHNPTFNMTGWIMFYAAFNIFQSYHGNNSNIHVFPGFLQYNVRAVNYLLHGHTPMKKIQDLLQLEPGLPVHESLILALSNSGPAMTQIEKDVFWKLSRIKENVQFISIFFFSQTFFYPLKKKAHHKLFSHIIVLSAFLWIPNNFLDFLCYKKEPVVWK